MLLISKFVAWSPNLWAHFYPRFQWNGKYRESDYVDFQCFLFPNDRRWQETRLHGGFLYMCVAVIFKFIDLCPSDIPNVIAPYKGPPPLCKWE